MYITFSEWVQLHEKQFQPKGPTQNRNLAAPVAGSIADAIGAGWNYAAGPDAEPANISYFMFQQEESLDGKNYRITYEVPVDHSQFVDENGQMDSSSWNKYRKELKLGLIRKFQQEMVRVYQQEGLSDQDIQQHIGAMYPPSGPKIGNPYAGQDERWYVQVVVYFPKPGHVDDIISSGNPESKNYQPTNTNQQAGQTGA